MDRAAKKELVETLNTTFKSTGVAVVAHYSGLTVAQMQVLRAQARQAGASVKVAKNRLAKIALEGTDVVAIALEDAADRMGDAAGSHSRHGLRVRIMLPFASEDQTK